MRPNLAPDWMHWCDGSREEYNLLVQQMRAAGALIALNPHAAGSDAHEHRLLGFPREGEDGRVQLLTAASRIK
jgi:GTP-dependent phosphoenolpyruvate carboxykinase